MKPRKKRDIETKRKRKKNGYDTELKYDLFDSLFIVKKERWLERTFHNKKLFLNNQFYNKKWLVITMINIDTN